MHKAERAIIMAAGLGTRLKPATDDTPKPMVKVNGIRMIDTVIDALHKNGINEIHVVTGYLAERFKEVKQKYPDIDILYNPYYETRNNISSMFVAREYLHNAICVDGDQVIYNPDILTPYFEYSCLDEQGAIISFAPAGNGYMTKNTKSNISFQDDMVYVFNSTINNKRLIRKK